MSTPASAAKVKPAAAAKTAGPITAVVKQKIMERKEREKLRNSTDVKVYLFAYNAIQTLGWGYMLVQLAFHYLTGGSVATAFDEIGGTLKLFQTLAVMEIVHSVTGVVPSPFFSTFIQVLSRVYVTWGILFNVEESQQAVFFSVLVVAWSVTEVIRYSYYALNIFGEVPRWLKKLRYSTFIVLYPLGVSMEIALILTAMPVIRDTNLFYFPLPNRLNVHFNFYYAQFLVLLAYLPGFPQLYMYMWKQRKIQLSKKKD